MTDANVPDVPDDEVFVQHRFTIFDEETGQLFSDALVMPQSEYRKLSAAKQEQLKAERFEAHKRHVREASAAPTEHAEDAG